MSSNVSSTSKREEISKKKKGTSWHENESGQTDKCLTWRILISLSASISSIVALIEYEKENTKNWKKKNTYSTQGKQHHFILQLLRILIISILYIWKFI